MTEAEIGLRFNEACSEIDRLAVTVSSLDPYLICLVENIRRFPQHRAVFCDLLISGMLSCTIPDEVIEYCFEELRWVEFRTALIDCQEVWSKSPLKLYYWQRLTGMLSEVPDIKETDASVPA